MIDVHTIIISFLNFLASIEPGYALAVFAITIVVYQLHLMNRSPDSKISFEDLFINPKTGKMGGTEFRLNTAFLVTTWAMIFMVLKGTLTEWFFMAYLATFLFDKYNSRQKDSKDTSDDNKESQPGTGTPGV